MSLRAKQLALLRKQLNTFESAGAGASPTPASNPSNLPSFRNWEHPNEPRATSPPGLSNSSGQRSVGVTEEWSRGVAEWWTQRSSSDLSDEALATAEAKA